MFSARNTLAMRTGRAIWRLLQRRAREIFLAKNGLIAANDESTIRHEAPCATHQENAGVSRTILEFTKQLANELESKDDT